MKKTESFNPRYRGVFSRLRSDRVRGSADPENPHDLALLQQYPADRVQRAGRTIQFHRRKRKADTKKPQTCGFFAAFDHNTVRRIGASDGFGNLGSAFRRRLCAPRVSADFAYATNESFAFKTSNQTTHNDALRAVSQRPASAPDRSAVKIAPHAQKGCRPACLGL